MTDVNVSPVTEVEVRNLMERICTSIVAHSQQDQELHTLRNDVADLTDRLKVVNGINTNLRKDLSDSEALATMYEDERGKARKDYETERDRASHLEGLMLARDTRVNDLTQKAHDADIALASQRDTINQQENRIESLLRRNDELVYTNDDLRTKLNLITTDAAKAHEDLRKLQETFKSVFAVTQPEPVKETNPIPAQTQVAAPEMKPVIDNTDDGDRINRDPIF